MKFPSYEVNFILRERKAVVKGRKEVLGQMHKFPSFGQTGDRRDDLCLGKKRCY